MQNLKLWGLAWVAACMMQACGQGQAKGDFYTFSVAQEKKAYQDTTANAHHHRSFHRYGRGAIVASWLFDKRLERSFDLVTSHRTHSAYWRRGSAGSRFRGGGYSYGK